MKDSVSRREFIKYSLATGALLAAGEGILAVGRVVGGVHVDNDHLPGTWMGFEVRIQTPVLEPA